MSLPEPPQPDRPPTPSMMPPPPPPPPVGPPPAPAYTSPMAAVVQPLRGSGKAVIVLYWVVVGVNALGLIAIWNRRGVLNDVIDRGTVLPSDAAADDRARGLIVAAFIATFAMQLVAAIVTAVWSRKVAMNAQQRGAIGVNPGKAAWGWFVPIGFYWIGFNQVRDSLASTGRRIDDVKRWQAAFVISSVIGWLFRNAGNSDGNTVEAIRDATAGALVQTAVSVVLLGITAVMAMQAVQSVNDALSGD